ncbi:MAG: Drug resistance transporter, EmrB/QacA subfamily [Pseudonocardiales bacterium]|nr:Drug resistance transporter, EmrB/QacA subfamily [Pseudonocardiales bacterium]
MLYGPSVASSLEKIQLDASSEPELTRAQLTKRRVTLLLVAGGAFVATLDLFIVNIAFDTIREHFSESSPAQLSWVLNAYGIVFAALLVPAGKMADRFGRRRLFRLGMTIFATGGILCALSPSVETLIAFRAFEAIGGALMTPTSLGLLLAAYPVERHRTIISWWSAITTTAAALGPPIGGLLVSANWRLIFVINLPIALAVILFGRVLPDDQHQKDTGLPDFLGAGLLAVGIASGVAAISNASKWGLGDPKLWLCIAVGTVAMIAFFVRCARISRPIVDLALLRVRQFGAANGALILFGAGFAGILLGGPLFLQVVWHYSSARAGIAYMPGPIFATIFALVSARLPITRRTSAVIGCLWFAAGSMWWYFLLDQTPNYLLHFMPGGIMTGLAVGFGMAAMIGVGASALPSKDYSTGTGVLNTSRQIGSAVGVAVVVAIVGSSTAYGTFHHAYLFTALCGLAAACVATLLIEPAPIRRA